MKLVIQYDHDILVTSDFTAFLQVMFFSSKIQYVHFDETTYYTLKTSFCVNINTS